MFKAQLPKPIDKAMVMKSCYLRNGDSEMVIEFTLDPSHYGITSSDMIQGFNELTPTDRKKFLGQEFTQMAQLLPVPIYAIFIFPDGQKYNMRLSE